MDEPAFLNAVASNPKDDAVLLIYADWLDEQDDATATAKATFLRLTTQLPRRTTKYYRHPIGRQLIKLATDLDPAWLAVVSRLRVHRCGKNTQGRRVLPVLTFDFLCDRRWEEMQPTADTRVRHCEECQQSVHYCATINEARLHAVEGHCIAVDIAIPKNTQEMADRPYRRMGRVSVETFRHRMALRRNDPVSEAREQRQRDAQ